MLWRFFKKTQALITATLMALTAFASAQPCNPCNDSPCGRWAIISDTLYLTATQGGLTYGSESEALTFGGTGSVTKYETKIKHLHQRWDLGWRLGVGYQSPCECWDAALLWTHFDTDTHAKHDDPVNPNQWFTPAWNSIPVPFTDDDPNLLGGNLPPDGTTSFPVQYSYAHWKLRMNLVDLEIGREFCVNSCLSLRPHVGVRGASINEKYKIKYEVIAAVGASELAAPIDYIDLKNDFEGAGVRGGLDTDFDLGCGLSIYGGVAVSLLYGETEINSKERLIVTTLPTSNVFETRQKDNDCGCRAITDAEIGIRWQKCCFNKIIVTEIGWEHHFFFNENQFEKYTNFDGTDNAATDRFPQVAHGDLSVQGLVWSTRVYF